MKFIKTLKRRIKLKFLDCRYGKGDSIAKAERAKKMGEIERAKEIYDNIINKLYLEEGSRAANIYTDINRGIYSEKGMKIFESCRSTDDLVEMAIRSGLIEKAIEYELKGGNIYSAGMLAKEHGKGRRAKEIFNESPKYWCEVAEAAKRSNKPIKSKKYYKKALDACEKNFHEACFCGLIRYIAKDSGLFKEAIDICLKNDDFIFAGMIAEKGELFKEASKYFEKCGVHYYKKAGENAEKAGLHEKAKEYYESYIPRCFMGFEGI